MGMNCANEIYVIVIVRSQGFMAVNELSPRAQPEDKVCLHYIKSLATCAITVIQCSPLNSNPLKMNFRLIQILSDSLHIELIHTFELVFSLN